MKTSLLVALVAGGQTTFEQTSSIFPLFLLYFIFLSGLLFSLSLSLLVSLLLVLRRDVCKRG
jgi:hypothetical protein